MKRRNDTYGTATYTRLLTDVLQMSFNKNILKSPKQHFVH
jgi:hypothetical protein